MKNVLKIGAAARLLGMGQQSIRRYDRLELFIPRRDRAGHRVYTAEDLDAIRAIRASRKPGRPRKGDKPPRTLVPVMLGDNSLAFTAKEIARGLKRGQALKPEGQAP